MRECRKTSVVLSIFGAMVLAGAAFLASAQTGPSLQIISPADGETITGDAVTISWESSGVTIVPAAEAMNPEEGHFHLFLNRDDFRPGVEIPREMEEEGIFHTANHSFELTGLEPGSHKVIVVLSYDNHVPWDPLVTASVTFNIE